MEAKRARGALLYPAGWQGVIDRKKRGLGAGKVNGPGGRIEPGESELEAAIRETQEEVGVTPLEVREIGRLHFDFRDGYSLHCTVFTASDFQGNLIETDEALPFWRDEKEIPYERMWQTTSFGSLPFEAGKV